MVNTYKERAQEADSKITKSWYQWGWAWVMTAVGAVLIFVGTMIANAGSGCQGHANTVHNWSQQNAQEAQKIRHDVKEDWKREVQREQVDSDSISITSSDDGEVVEIVA